MRLKLILLTSLLAATAYATDRDVAYNTQYFDGVNVSSDDHVLVVTLDPQIVKPGSDKAELILYPAPAAPRREDSCALDATPSEAFALDCGARVLGIENSASKSEFTFYLQASQGEWYQVVLDPRIGLTIWTKDEHTPGIHFSTRTITDWLVQGDSFQAADDLKDSLSILETPDDASKVLTDCASYNIRDWEGLVPAAKSVVQGDWVQVGCIENGCCIPTDPTMQCKAHQDCDGKIVACVQGWTRWRTVDGQVRLYPFVALSNGC